MNESESTSPSIERILESGGLGGRIDRRCPICKSDAKRWKNVRSFEIAECENCAHRFLANPVSSDHVERIYGDDYFFGGGAGYSNYVDQSSLLRGRGRDYARRIKKYRNVPGKVLDVGAAAGFLLEGWIEEGWRGVGVEPNRTMCKHAEARGIDVRCGTVETLEMESDGPWDLVSMVQVISHLSEPVDSIRKLVGCLAPGGLLLVETWDRTSWFARLCGSGWHEYSPPSVLHWFTPQTLELAATTCGLRPIATGKVLRWLQIGHAKSLLRHASKESTLMRMAYWVSLPFPVSWSVPYPGDDLRWSIFQKPF